MQTSSARLPNARFRRLLSITCIFKQKYAWYLFQWKCKKNKATRLQSNDKRISTAQIRVIRKSRLNQLHHGDVAVVLVAKVSYLTQKKDKFKAL